MQLLYRGLSVEPGLIKGMNFTFLMWLFRVAMYAASRGVMFNVPVKTLFHTLAAGLDDCWFSEFFMGRP